MNIKLLHNFTELTRLEKIAYFLFTRPFSSKADRLFFEGSLVLPGQMYKAERKALYDIVRESSPDYCFEIGTYTGGGSTFFISRALRDNKNGKLLTIECDERLYEKARQRYSRYIRSQYPYIEFHLGSTPGAFEEALRRSEKSNMIFLDGAEDGTQTLEQYDFFKPYFKEGTILALHDWNTEKTSKVKPVILGDSHWVRLTELQQPESIGFAIFKSKE